MPAGAVVVSRPSVWGSPFKVGEPVHRTSPLWPYIAPTVPGGPGGFQAVAPMDPQGVVDLYSSWVIEQPHLMLRVGELAGRDLVCWCPAGAPCHGDWLLELATVDQEAP